MSSHAPAHTGDPNENTIKGPGHRSRVRTTVLLMAKIRNRPTAGTVADVGFVGWV